MYTIQDRITKELADIKASGLYKNERVITSAQGAEIVVNGKTVLNFCANNYLGLSSNPKVMEAAKSDRSRKVMACRVSGSFAAHKTFIRSMEKKFLRPGNRRHHFICRCF
jgi:7-keto-8-aminopelargonate synthetase-like enzyme